MRIMTIVDVDNHLRELRKDAARARMARMAHPAHPGHNSIREFFGSLVASARVALEPALPMVDAPSYRN